MVGLKSKNKFAQLYNRMKMNKPMKQIQSGLVVLVIAVLLSSCAQPFPVPEKIEDQGLVVGQISADEFSEFWSADPVINGKRYKNAMQKGYILLALKPGHYTLNEFNQVLSTTRTTFPVKRGFTVEPGKVTNLGLMVFQPSRAESNQGRAGLYNIFYLENNREMATFLKETHPGLYASLRSKELITAPTNYLNSHQINQLRFNIASQKISLKQWRQHFGNSSGYVSGSAGTLAQVIRDSAGNITTLKILETNTLADLAEFTSTSNAIGGLISTTSYLVVNDDKVIHRVLPPGIVGNSLLALNESTVVVVDDLMNVYTSLDSGASWKKYSAASMPQSVEASWNKADPKHRFRFYLAKRGFYIFPNYANAEQSRLIYADYETATFHQLHLPSTVEKMTSIRETDAGVYIGPRSTLSNGKVHFLPKGKEKWEIRELPQSSCFDIAFPDNLGDKLQVLCSGGTVWVSNNGGLNWSSTYRINSLFKD